MQRLCTALVIVAGAAELGGAQQFVGKADTSAHAALGRSDSTAPARVTGPRARAAAKREVERIRRTVDVVRGTQIAIDASRWLGQGRLMGSTLLTSRDEQTAYVIVRRSISSKPEVHARWDDIVIVRSGKGTIELGDSLVNSRYRAPGERAGGSIVGTYRIIVQPGDIVRIPAAVPHAFVVDSAQTLEYLVIKSRKQELPIRWFGDQ
ncbi:MAG: cupin domain-containing protein [Gemmatimonadaceae bacterium]